MTFEIKTMFYIVTHIVNLRLYISDIVPHVDHLCKSAYNEYLRVYSNYNIITL